MTSIDSDTQRRMERNLRLLPWWWVLRWTWLGEAIWVIYLIDLRGVTLGQVFLFNAVASAVVVVSQLPTGILADRYGRRPVMLAASGVMAIGFPLFGLTESIPLLLASFTVFALGDALMTGADEAFIFDTLRALGRESEFPRRVGRLHAATTLATAVLAVAGALMVRWTPLAWPIVASGGFSLVAIAFGLGLTEPPRRVDRLSFLRTGRSAARRVVRSGALSGTIAMMAIAQTAGIVVFVTFQPIVRDYGIPVWALGGFSAFIMLSAAAGGWWSGALGQRLGFDRSLRIIPALAAVALLGGASGMIWLFPVFALATFSWMALAPLIADFIAQRVPDEERATVLSINQLAAQLLGVAVSLAIGAGIDRWGSGGALAATSGAMLVMVALAYLLWRTGGAADSDTAEATINDEQETGPPPLGADKRDAERA